MSDFWPATFLFCLIVLTISALFSGIPTMGKLIIVQLLFVSLYLNST